MTSISKKRVALYVTLTLLAVGAIVALWSVLRARCQHLLNTWERRYDLLSNDKKSLLPCPNVVSIATGIFFDVSCMSAWDVFIYVCLWLLVGVSIGVCFYACVYVAPNFKSRKIAGSLSLLFIISIVYFSLSLSVAAYDRQAFLREFGTRDHRCCPPHLIEELALFQDDFEDPVRRRQIVSHKELYNLDILYMAITSQQYTNFICTKNSKELRQLCRIITSIPFVNIMRLWLQQVAFPLTMGDARALASVFPLMKQKRNVLTGQVTNIPDLFLYNCTFQDQQACGALVRNWASHSDADTFMTYNITVRGTASLRDVFDSMRDVVVPWKWLSLTNWQWQSSPSESTMFANPVVVNMPNLTWLQLERMTFRDGDLDVIRQLLAGCPKVGALSLFGAKPFDKVLPWLIDMLETSSPPLSELGQMDLDPSIQDSVPRDPMIDLYMTRLKYLCDSRRIRIEYPRQ